MSKEFDKDMFPDVTCGQCTAGCYCGAEIIILKWKEDEEGNPVHLENNCLGEVTFFHHYFEPILFGFCGTCCSGVWVEDDPCLQECCTEKEEL